MSKEYYDTCECSNCGDETPHYIYSVEHERDSSNDFVVCLKCGGRKGGHDDEHGPPDPESVKLYERDAGS